MLLRTLLLSLFVFTFLFSKGQSEDSLVFKTFYFDGGTKSSEGHLKNGEPEGYWKSFYPNGQIKTEGNRQNFLLDGPWKFYSEEGNLTVEINYKEGLKHGPRKSYENGNIIRIDNFVEDNIEGLSKYFYPDGELKRDIPYVKDKKEGLGFEYDKSGRIVGLLNYKADVLTKRRKINQYDELGQKQSTWMSFYKNRALKVEGPFINDLKNGYWKYYTAKGSLIKVEKWIMGVLQENAEEVAKIEVIQKLNPKTGELAFKGSYRNGIEEGVHRIYDENGNVISSKIYENGIVLFEGIVDDQGRKQGPWKEFYPTGELKSKGDYKDNLKVRNWEYYFVNGKIEQKGSYLRGRAEGEWFWYYENNQILRQEEYVDGMRDGPFVEYSDSGSVIAQGNYIEDLKDGEWIYQQNDYREVGKYFDGLRTGEWIHYQKLDDDEEMVIFKGNYENGLENGLHIYYFPNGKEKRRGKYVAGKKEGIWDYYKKNGKKLVSIEYAGGVEIKYNGEKISYGRKLDRELAKEAEESKP